MSARYLLDTNICIYIAKHNPPAVRGRFAGHAANELAMSVITLGELRFGAEQSHSREQAMAVSQQLAALIPPLALTEAAGDPLLAHQLGRRGRFRRRMARALLPIEVKSSKQLRLADSKSLAVSRQEYGKQALPGLVLYDGTDLAGRWHSGRAVAAGHLTSPSFPTVCPGLPG